MYVIDVIPLSRTAPPLLSYRSKQELPAGTIVSIQVRRTATQGIVVNSMPVTAAKEMLKHARFLLSRSLPSPSGMLPEAVLRAAERAAVYYATTPGAVLAAMFAEHVRAGIELTASALDQGAGYSKIGRELPHEGRAKEYAHAIRACLASGKAALLIAPTIPEISYWKDALAEFDPLVLSGSATGAKRAKALAAAAMHSALVIATPSFGWVPIERLGLAIIDRISAGTYMLPKRPYISLLQAIDFLMQERSIPVMLGDFPLPLEYRAENADLPPAAIPQVTLIDARRPADAVQDREPWSAVPPSVIDAIRREIDEGGRAIVLAARKGYAPAVVCRDCGQAQADEHDRAYSFSTAHGDRVFRTSDGTAIEAKRACQRCGSWNLLPLGIGIERIEEELREKLPDASIIIVPPESLSSPRKTRTAVQEAQRSGTIVIGTEALLPWLYSGKHPGGRASLGVIASADSLLSQPFWRARERFVRLACFLGGFCRELLLVTRRPEDAAVGAVTDPGSPAFWEEERSLRRALGYPPYGTIITLSIDGSQARSSFEGKEIGAELAEYHPQQLTARFVKGTVWRTTLVLHLPQDAWPDEELSTRLRSLPPSVRIRIDPESIW